MEYPKIITLEDPKLIKLVKEKADLVLVGREVSVDIEACELEMKKADEAIQAIENAVDRSDIDEEAKRITEEMNGVVLKMEDLKKRLNERLKAHVPPESIAVYENALKRKEALETDRNKIGLKIQKINDKIIPLGRKLMKPYITDEFEDYDTLRLEDGKIVATLFSHLETFKTNFAKTKK